MSDINLGGTIRELRKQRGITQETLAAALSVTPQAVSKWESGVSFPDMNMVPLIAGYFEVSLDTLFDFDLRKVKTHIQKILEDAGKYFFDEPARYGNAIRAALAENPGSEDLLIALLDHYEHVLRNFDDTTHLDEMIDIAHQLISSSRDFVKVCDAKDNLAAAYLKKGNYDKAKEILETLPKAVCLRDDYMSFRLSGKDKIDAAKRAQKYHLQDLYLACWEEGNGWYKEGEYQKALDSYNRGLAALTAFMVPGGKAEGAYLWRGMQTFHYGFHLCRAGCFKKLGQLDLCPAEVDRAYEIIRTAWSDFEEKTDYYMENFYDCLREQDLEEYRK